MTHQILRSSIFAACVYSTLLLSTSFAFASPADGFRLCKSGSTSCPSKEGYGHSKNSDQVVAGCTCKRLVSTCNNDIFVPTKDAASWDGFIANKPPCVALTPCTNDPTTQTLSATGSAQTVTVPSGCGFVSIVAKGAGGGGGDGGDGGGDKPGPGGPGGQSTLSKSAVSTSYTVTVGAGGKAGKCSSPPGGGSGSPGTEGGATTVRDASGAEILKAGGGGGGPSSGDSAGAAGSGDTATGGKAGVAGGGCGGSGDGGDGSVTFTFTR